MCVFPWYCSGVTFGHVKPISVSCFYKVEATTTVYNYHTNVAACVVTHTSMNKRAAMLPAPVPINQTGF